MTLAKLLRVLEMLEALHGHLPSGNIDCTGGGELRISFRSQPNLKVHEYMLRQGFITNDSDYIYRPK